MDDEDTISLDDELELLVEVSPPTRRASATKPPPLPASVRRLARGSERAITAN